MIASARAGCDLCTLCWQHADEWASEEKYLDQPIRLFRQHGTVMKSAPFILLGDGIDVWIGADDLPCRPSPLEVEEDPVSQAQQLLSRCLSSHCECGKIDNVGLDGIPPGFENPAACYSTQRSLPRRLLDLSKGSDVLVVDVEAHILNGALSVAELSQYCTLSYRWGDTPHGCVLRAPFARQISIEVESMPQTFRDAIETTRGLGMRFLWIDALCIVQPDAYGDDTDWNTEGPRMGTTYQNAICNIAATCADSAKDGFLSKTDSKRIGAAPCQVFQHMSSGDMNVRLLKPVSIKFNQALTSSALNKRGWVTQERLLSRRVLHFTLQGVIWECGSALEHGHTNVLEVTTSVSGLNWSARFGNGPRQATWMYFVADYSKTEFTNSEDRLVALSSLASLVHRKFNSDDLYCAGLWKSRLPEDLLWYKFEPPNVDTPNRMKIAPTWSWASVHGSILRRGGSRTRDILVQVLDVHFTLAQHSNPYGNIQSGSIKLLAQVVTILIETENVREGRLPPLDMGNGESNWHRRTIYWDEWQGNTTKEKEYDIIPVGTDRNREHTALIVERVHATDIQATKDGHVSTYRRIGLLQDQCIGTNDPTRYNYGKPKQDMQTVFLV